MAAVQQNGHAVHFAAKECKAHRELMLAAVEAKPLAIQFVSDELMLDSTFAPEAKQERGYILKLSLLSGRSTAITAQPGNSAEEILRSCC
eukprot:1218979-Amphidinium_carterae.1